jgi:hypothetical protein
MAPTSIFFNGRVISVPGSYSEVDASGLEAIGLGAAGIIGLIGTAEGGIPVSALTGPEDFIRITKPEASRSLFRSGNLREGIPLLFEPSSDPDVPGGAVEVVAMKVNPATQSVATFSNAQGPAVDMTSADYGAFTEQINVSIGAGTVQGKLLTVIFEDTTESWDDVGGDDFLKLKYVNPGDGWATMTAQVNAGGILKANGTRSSLGLDSEVTDTVASGVVEVVSASGADVGQTVRVYGLDGSNAAVSEDFTLNGTTTQIGTQTFNTAMVLGARVIGTTAGAVTVKVSPGGATIMTLAAGANDDKGMLTGSAMYAASVLSLVSSGASTKVVILEGNNVSGTRFLEKVTLTGTTPVPSTGVFSLVTGIVLGDVEAAQTITVSATAAQTDPTVQTTLQKVVDYYNARYVPSVGGFVATLVTTLLTFDPDNLDVSVSAVNCLSPAEPGFKADLWSVINQFNTNSVLVTAVRATGASGGAPNNTTSPVFLQGGIEGTASASDWQDAYNWLKQARINTLVPLTHDAAVHAVGDAHCAYMGGVGRSERDQVVGALNTGGTGLATKTELKAQIVNLNSRHTRLVGQAVDRYNTALVRTTFNPTFHACIIAGMQAGSPIGEPLTFKYANVLAFSQDISWNPVDDAEEMVQAGLCFLENVQGVGRRVVRNITTHRSTSNLAFIEGSVNEAVNHSAYNFRTNMEFAVGRKGFAGTITAGKGVAVGTLGLLVDEEILVAWRALDLELLLDVMEVSVELSPVLPINFVKNTIHLVTIRQTA